MAEEEKPVGPDLSGLSPEDNMDKIHDVSCIRERSNSLDGGSIFEYGGPPGPCVSSTEPPKRIGNWLVFEPFSGSLENYPLSEVIDSLENLSPFGE